MTQSANKGPLTYQQVLDRDGDAPQMLREEAPAFVGGADLPIDRYISRQYHELEKERLWSRTWQFACREEHIPSVGDYVIYEIAGRSSVVVRSEANVIKAFPNACLHRGRQLKSYAGHCSEIRCPFHGFAWHLDGNLKHIPGEWEFPHVNADEFHLPELRVGTWAGYVFVNPDPQAQPLHEFLGVLPEHFSRWAYDDRYVEAHVAKVIRANWKIAQEAFMESLHVNATHPQVLPYSGDLATQVDIFGNVSRAITPSEVSSPLLEWEPDADTMLRVTLDLREGETQVFRAREGQTAREAIADSTRDQWRKHIGDAIDDWSIADLVDNHVYTVFPNMHPWGGVHKICYRFRPNGDDHRSSIMEVFLISPFHGDRPEPAAIHWLDVDESWTNAPELGILGKVFDQDSFNMERVQRGLESTAKPGVTLSQYQESKIRWFHSLLDDNIGQS